MYKILIIDDEPDILDTLTELIEAKFSMATIYTATNGLDGFLACQQDKFDMIITDHKMPFMTGAALIIGIRTKEPNNQKTPICMLSGHIDENMRKTLGIQNVLFVEKPFTPQHLLDIIRTYLT